MKIVICIRDLLLKPREQWLNIARENADISVVFRGFVAPLLATVALCTLAGSLLFTSRLEFSAGFVAHKILLLMFALGGGLYLSAYLINAIMIQFGSRNKRAVFILLAYSSSAALTVLAIVELLPFDYLKELMALGFYSLYLYWRGIPFMLTIPPEKRGAFMLMSAVVIAACYGFLFFFVGKILNAIFL